MIVSPVNQLVSIQPSAVSQRLTLLEVPSAYFIHQPSAYFIEKLFGVALAMGINCSGSVATALLADTKNLKS
ncbi:MAG: hypothetical protein F6K50_52690 [Moorea sp. SIO3I7]|uniref:hypothetical protein n=1 Tax=unclassified Moorena TaxID=2683338 RepID=UPI0013CD3FD2|nr:MULTISPECIES: hypothetical protein [unclassified Moorena]NEO03646.1 hypothetical protein [Moorena sp. SIO3I7]NEO17801.1 hypothetical protein [Moorena sp. SIO3E8]NEO65017.1 hypothetical protein [Moorena sp. SIO4G2]NEQ04371.1 hypothetical protein [Moorena sp. SIO3F7]